MDYKFDEFTPVTHKIIGTVRENSLYHFVRENPSCVTGFMLNESNTETRDALYITPNTDTLAQLFFRGIEPTRPHLSIDKLFSRENARHADGFGPAHWTVSYGDFRLHVYFNDRGEILDTHVRSDLDGSYLTLSEAEQKHISEQVKPVQALLKEIISNKQKAYLNLQSALIDQEALLLKTKTLKAYLEQARTYLEIVDTINRYSDTEQIRQGIHIERLMAQKMAKPITEKRAEKAESKETIPEVLASEKRTDEATSIETASKLDTFKAELQATIQEVNACYERGETSPAHLIPLLQQIEYLGLEIAFSGRNTAEKEANQKYIKKQKGELPVTLEMLSEAFENKLYHGDVDYVRENYTSISNITKLAPLFFSFITKLTEKPANPDLQRRQLLIADYLYEHSELYRSTLSVQSYMLRADAKQQLGYGLLANCFLNNNLEAFKVFLKHGISPDIAQLMYNSQFLNALQTMTLLFEQNENADFIEALIEHGASLSQAQQKSITHTASMQDIEHAQGKKLSIKHLKKFKAADQKETSEAREFFQRAIKDNHALKTATRRYAQKHPELIKLLASQAEPIVLYEVLSDLTNDSRIITRSSIDCSGKLDLSFLFFLNDRTRETEEHKTNLITSIGHVLSTAQTKLNELEPQEQRELIKSLSQMGDEVALTGDWMKAANFQRSALFAYTHLATKTDADDTNAYRTYVKMAEIIQPHNPEVAKAETIRARQFFEGICSRRRRRAQSRAVSVSEVSVFEESKDEVVDTYKTVGEAKARL